MGSPTSPSSSVGLMLLLAGIVLAAIGILVWLGALDWFGHLPGDVRIERDSTRLYVPITSMLLLSAAVSLALYLIRKLL